MRIPLLIAAKDLRRRLRDRSALLIAVVVPLALGLIFSATLADVSGGDITFDYAVVDQDRGHVADAFVTGVLGEVERQGVITLRIAASPEEGRRLADRGTVAATFVVPAGFSDAVTTGRPTTIQVIGDPKADVGVVVARALAEGFAADATSVQRAVATVAVSRGITGQRSLSELGERAAATQAPLAIADISATRKELEPQTFFAAGMAVFFLFFTVQFGISSVLEERRDRTMARMLVAPIRPTTILVGKLLASLVLGTVSMVVLAVTTGLVLGASWGDPLGVGALIVAGVIAATAVMALVATLANTPEQAGYWQSIVALVLGMLGGSFFPVAQAGGMIETLSLGTPHAWFLRGLGELSNGGGIGDIVVPLIAILAFAAVCAAAALARIGRLVRP
jgi:ABC-2 type transport system permease protein